jgi:hypothetical protein
MGTWYEKVSGLVPDAPIVRDLVESVERVPGLDCWSPRDGLENHWIELISWGFVLWMSRSLAGVDRLQRALGAEIVASGGPAPDTFAELSGAGLCVSLGAVAGGRIPRGNGKTADWRMVWPEDAGIDVEVTVARRKERHVERQALAMDLTKTLFKADRDFDLVVDLVNPTIFEDREAILAVAKTITSGQDVGSPGRWQLRAKAITRNPTVLFTGGQNQRPTWWPVDDARCSVFHGYVAGLETQHAPPQVQVFFGVPYDSYVNPIMRKANFPQGTAGLPFLVAIDISNLPGAFSEMPRAVTGFLPLWKALSGILLFHNLMGIDRVGWLWRLITNPYADVPLPESLCGARANLPQTMETGVRLSKEHQKPAGAA